MIRYSWKAIMLATNGKAADILLAIRALSKDSKPRNKKDPLYKYKYTKSMDGNSFLLNEKDLLLNQHKYKLYDLCMYIYLASLRNYEEYRVLGVKYLDVRLCRVDMQKVLNNPLLKVENLKIKFKYEE